MKHKCTNLFLWFIQVSIHPHLSVYLLSCGFIYLGTAYRCIWSSLHALVHVCIQKVVSPILYTSWHIHVCIDNCINKYKFYKHRYEVSSWQFCLHRNRYYIYVYTHIFRNIDIKSSVVYIYIYIDISLYNHIISKLKILFKILFELT